MRKPILNGLLTSVVLGTVVSKGVTLFDWQYWVVLISITGAIVNSMIDD